MSGETAAAMEVLARAATAVSIKQIAVAESKGATGASLLSGALLLPFATRQHCAAFA